MREPARLAGWPKDFHVAIHPLLRCACRRRYMCLPRLAEVARLQAGCTLYSGLLWDIPFWPEARVSSPIPRASICTLFRIFFRSRRHTQPQAPAGNRRPFFRLWNFPQSPSPPSSPSPSARLRSPKRSYHIRSRSDPTPHVRTFAARRYTAGSLAWRLGGLADGCGLVWLVCWIGCWIGCWFGCWFGRGAGYKIIRCSRNTLQK
ncbi:hypothetical protein J3F84DRAFT_223517 [Trichoderma pleuroticola]